MMKTRLIGLLFFLFLLPVIIFSQETPEQIKAPNTIVNDGMPPIPADIQIKMKSYSDIKSAMFASWLPDTKGLLVSSRLGNTTQLYSVASPLAVLNQVTNYDEPVNNAIVCPDSSKHYFIFSKDTGGGENYQYYSYDLMSGKVELLTDGKSRNEGLIFNHKGDKVIFASTIRTGIYYDMYMMNPAKPSEKKLVFEAKSSAMYIPSCWFYDDRHLIIVEFISINETNSYILDTETGEVKKIDPGTSEKCRFEIKGVSPDGVTAYGMSDRLSEMVRLIKINLKMGAIDTITKDIQWDVDLNSFTKDFKYADFEVNEGGIARLYILDLSNDTYRKIDSVPAGSIGSVEFNDTGDKLALSVSNSRMNSDVFVLDLSTGKPERWTMSDTGGLDMSSFSEPELIEYPTFDTVDGSQRKIPAFYYKPSVKTDKPFPVIIYIHGGPESQFTSRFYPIFNYYIRELGIAVIAPNVRGSSGYGKSYLLLDNAEKREDSVKDIGSLLDWIATRPELDKKRISVMGGSYGGYMVLSSMVNFSDRLACGVDIVGISNFVTFLKNTSPYRQDQRRSEYGDERVIGDLLNKISPLTNAVKITKPLFVIQGKNDPRVPWTEAEQIVKIVRNNGVPVWYQTALNEGHGFAKKDNRDFMEYSVVKFLQEFLLK